MRAEKLPSQVRRGQIVEAVLVLVASEGLRGVSVAAVARRVGLVPSAIYRHFKSKDDMLDAALEHIRDRLLRNLEAVREGTPDPMERLHRLLMSHVRLVREGGLAIPRIVFFDEAASGHAQRRVRVHQIVKAYLGGVAEVVREGQETGRIRRDVDASTVALMLVGLFQPAAALWHLSEGGFDVTQHAKRAWRVFGEAIRAG